MLTSDLCKLMERMVTVRLRWYLESNNLLNQYQSAFRERRRPLHHLSHLHNAVHKTLANQRSVLAVFLDIEKAYDLVYKDILLIKLLNFGVNGFMRNFFAAFLTNRSFQVRISSAHSQVKHLHNGIPQWSVLSPLLFAVMINDLPTCLNSEVALFEDDVCFWETDTDTTVLNKLAQSSLNKSNAWCNINGFKMSINKSAALLLTKKRKNKHVSLILNNRS